MESKRVRQSIPRCVSNTLSILKSRFFALLLSLSEILVKIVDTILSLNFRLCDMSPCTIDLNERTTMHFWITNHRQFNKPNLVLIHGYGGHSRWQFISQVRPLSRAFNLYIPDLLFFGKSNTSLPDRTDVFQAECVREGLKKLGLDRYNVVGISYGGYVAYWMAARYGKEEVVKVVIVSSGICFTEEEKEEHLKKLGRNLYDLLLPTNPEDARAMVNLSMYKSHPMKLLPDFFLWPSISVMGSTHRKEKLELVQHLLNKKADAELPILTQETLLIWGEQDNVFPVTLAYQLQRHLGSRSRIETIKDTGHAANIESPEAVNSLIASFLLGHSSSENGKPNSFW